MSKIKDKVKEKVTDAKDKVKGVTEKATNTTKEGISSTKGSSTSNAEDRQFEEGGSGTDHEYGGKEDPLTQYKEKEPMTPAKIKEHEPTAVKREMSEVITEPGQAGQNTQEATERARRSGMTKGTAGATETETEDESEQGTA
jgi:hypothetical protein